jgi:hypothetical protein
MFCLDRIPVYLMFCLDRIPVYLMFCLDKIHCISIVILLMLFNAHTMSSYIFKLPNVKWH